MPYGVAGWKVGSPRIIIPMRAGFFYDPEPGKAGKTNARWGGYIQGIDQFDAHFFGISPREAEVMDPQQRIAAESREQFPAGAHAVG